VLSTVNTTDWIYTCDNHLKDPGFASPLGESDDGTAPGTAQKAGLSAEEIAQVTKEWEERQKRKQQKAKEREKEAKAEADKDSNKDKTEEKDGKMKGDGDSKDPKVSPPSSKSPSAPLSPAPTPPRARYALHRDIFAMRQHEHRKRKQTAQAKDLAPRFPTAPTSSLPNP
jgi:hypothetical protein